MGAPTRTLKGRRRDNLPIDSLHSDIQPGDYWQIGDGDDPGIPIRVTFPSNLTGTAWMVAAPMSYGFALGRLMKHTVREEADGTISVRPNDGSSNSILITGHHGEQWHGYIEHGEWRHV